MMFDKVINNIIITTYNIIMDILAKRIEIPDKINRVVKDLKINDNKIILLGSASLQSQQYFSDYDFYSSIVHKPVDMDYLFMNIQSILEKVRHQTEDGVYFIEFKIEYKDGQKIKLNKNDTLKKNMINKNIEIAKLDLIIYDEYEYEFIEVSILYDFKKVVKSPKKYVDNLKDEIDELKDEGSYYKVLKRLFSIYRLEKKTDRLLKLSEIFNSPLGEDYKKISNLKTLSILKDNYNDFKTHRLININLKKLREKTSIKLENRVKILEDILNKKSHKIYDEFIYNTEHDDED